MNDLIRITEFEEFEQNMVAFSGRYDAVVYDLDNPAQNKQARSDRFAISKVIAKLDKRHKEIKAPLKEKVDLLDGERKRIKDRLLKTQDGIKAQIANHEAAKQAIADALQKRIDAIGLLAESDVQLTAAEIKARIAEADAIDPESPEYDPRQADAALAHRRTRGALRGMLASREAYEAEQAELARLRAEEEKRIREEREEQIRQAAEEKAKREAAELAKRKAEESADRERALKAEKEEARLALLEAERVAKRREADQAAWREEQKEKASRREKELKEKAARDKAEAQKRAQEAVKRAAEQAAQAERDRAEKQRQQEADKAEAARKEAEHKAAHKTHRDAVERDIIEDLLAIETGDQDPSPIPVLEALKANRIRHVRIEY